MITNFQLKVVALLLMVVDHVGLYLLPENVGLRVVGRLAFPLFAYFFAQGYLHTSNHSRYLLRLLVTGIVAQVVLGMPCQFNILLTFSYNLVLLKLIEKSRPRFKSINLIMGALMGSFLNFDYGWYATVLIILLMEFKQKEFKVFSMWYLNWVVVNGISFVTIGILQPLAALSLMLLLLPVTEVKRKLTNLTRSAFYVFYPAHLALLGLAQQALTH